MEPRESSGPLAALLRAESQRKSDMGAPPARPLTIALSREAGALGTSVARELHTRLGWPVYDHEVLEQIAEELKVGVSQVERVDERPVSWMLERIETFASGARVTETAYFRRLLKLLASLGARGECIIVGRGAAQFLPAESTLRVRLLARLEDRIAVISRELGLSAADAARFVETSDRERRRFIREHFNKDPTDPQHYDLVLNTSRLTVPGCAEVILRAAQDFRARFGLS